MSRIHSQSPREHGLGHGWGVKAAGFSRCGWMCAAGLLCWLFPKSASAQQAYQSALSLDAVVAQQTSSQTETNPVVNLPALEPHWGPLGLNVGAYSSVTSDNNINLANSNTESDFILGTGLNLQALWQETGKSVVQLSSQVGYNFYLQHPDHDYLQITPGSALTWTLNLDDWYFTFFDQFNYTRNDIAVPSVSNISGIPIVQNNAGIRVQWEPGHWLFEGDYSYDNYFSTSSEYNYLNNAADYYFGRAGWRFASSTQAGIEASASFTHFTHPPQTDTTSYSAGPYVQWQVDPAINVNLHAGPTYYQFAASPNGGQPASSLTAYYINLDLVHKINQFWTEEVTVARSVNLGFNQGSIYDEELDLGYTLRWYPNPWLNFFASADYQTGQQPFQVLVFIPPNFIAASDVTEHYSRYGFSPGVYYQMTHHLNSSLVFSHWTRESNIVINRYADDMVTLQIQYQF